MSATIRLGRACSISVGGSLLTGVRSVTASAARSEIEVPVFGAGETYIVPGHRTITIEVETVTVEDFTKLSNAMNDVSVGVSVSATHVSGTFIVTAITVNEPLDDVVSYTATLKRTVANA